MRASFDDVVRAAQVTVAETHRHRARRSASRASASTGRGGRNATLDGSRARAHRVGRRAATLGTAPSGGDLGEHRPRGSIPTSGDIGAFLMQSLLPLLLGVWSGSMIGQLAHHALGQYDLPLPLHGPPTQRFLVRNVEAFGEEWSLPADELRYALALREVVHGAQRSVPWVRDELERLATEYVAAYEVQPDALQEQLGDLNLADPSSMASLTQLGDPERAARRDALRPPGAVARSRCNGSCRCSRATPTSSSRRSASAMITSHARIDEALKRHRLDRGEAAAFVDRLLGLELDRGHYDAGVAFSRGVVERGGIEQLNRLWTGPR